MTISLDNKTFPQLAEKSSSREELEVKFKEFFLGEALGLQRLELLAVVSHNKSVNPQLFRGADALIPTSEIDDCHLMEWGILEEGKTKILPSNQRVCYPGENLTQFGSYATERVRLDIGALQSGKILPVVREL